MLNFFLLCGVNNLEMFRWIYIGLVLVAIYLGFNTLVI